MPTQAQPEILLHLDKPRKFKMNWNALLALENALGKEGFKALNWGEPSYYELTRILWAGLLSNDPSLTFEHLCEHMSFDVLAQIQPQMVQSINASVTPAEEGSEKKAKASKAA